MAPAVRIAPKRIFFIWFILLLGGATSIIALTATIITPALDSDDTVAR